jgi:hypothetical protein
MRRSNKNAIFALRLNPLDFSPLLNPHPLELFEKAILVINHPVHKRLPQLGKHLLVVRAVDQIGQLVRIVCQIIKLIHITAIKYIFV